MNSVYPPSAGVMFVNVSVYSYSWFATISSGPVNVFIIAVEFVSFTSIWISSFVKLNILKSFVKNLSLTLIFTIPLSVSTLGTDHTGSTTSTIVPFPVPSGSFFPIVIVCGALLFCDLSLTVPASNASDI